jgi:hypothetical protein
MPNPFQSGGYASLIPHSDQPQTQAPQMQTFRPLGTGSPLGGMNDGSLQMRGGPMSYNERGVGTNNPNAFRVGGPRLPTGMRLLDRAARHRDPRAISQLAGMEQQQMLQNQGQQFSAGQDQKHLSYQMGRDEQEMDKFTTVQSAREFEFRESYKRQMERDKLNFDQSQDAWNRQHDIQVADRDHEYHRGRNDMMTDEQRRAEQARETYGIKDPLTGQMMQGRIMTGNGQQITRDAPPLSPDDIAMARANGGDVTMPLPGGGQVSFNAPREVQPHYTPVPSQPAMIQGQETLPDRVFDPRTGQYFPAGQAPQPGQRQQAGGAGQQSGQSSSSGYNPFK